MKDTRNAAFGRDFVTRDRGLVTEPPSLDSTLLLHLLTLWLDEEDLDDCCPVCNELQAKLTELEAARSVE